MKQLESDEEVTHAMRMNWRMIPAMKSILKATHAIKGNLKEVSQPGERLPEHQEEWRREPRPLLSDERTAQKTEVYALLGHERIEQFNILLE